MFRPKSTSGVGDDAFVGSPMAVSYLEDNNVSLDDRSRSTMELGPCRHHQQQQHRRLQCHNSNPSRCHMTSPGDAVSGAAAKCHCATAIAKCQLCNCGGAAAFSRVSERDRVYWNLADAREDDADEVHQNPPKAPFYLNELSSNEELATTSPFHNSSEDYSSNEEDNEIKQHRLKEPIHSTGAISARSSTAKSAVRIQGRPCGPPSVAEIPMSPPLSVKSKSLVNLPKRRQRQLSESDSASDFD